MAGIWYWKISLVITITMHDIFQYQIPAIVYSPNKLQKIQSKRQWISGEHLVIKNLWFGAHVGQDAPTRFLPTYVRSEPVFRRYICFPSDVTEVLNDFMIFSKDLIELWLLWFPCVTYVTYNICYVISRLWFLLCVHKVT